MNNVNYEWPYNGSKLISKDKLKPFLKRNNINGLIHLGMHLGLIFLSGIVIYISTNLFIKILVMIAHGSFIAFLYAGLHECIHKSAFKNKKLDYKLITFFILPPSKKILLERLSNRDMKDKLIVEERMKQFNKDVLHWKKYNYVVINDDLKKCYDKIIDILDAEINDKKPKYDKIFIENHIKKLI